MRRTCISGSAARRRVRCEPAMVVRAVECAGQADGAVSSAAAAGRLQGGDGGGVMGADFSEDCTVARAVTAVGPASDGSGRKLPFYTCPRHSPVDPKADV